jgi:hypothetical protein
MGYNNNCYSFAFDILFARKLHFLSPSTTSVKNTSKASNPSYSSTIHNILWVSPSSSPSFGDSYLLTFCPDQSTKLSTSNEVSAHVSVNNSSSPKSIYNSDNRSWYRNVRENNRNLSLLSGDGNSSNDDDDDDSISGHGGFSTEIIRIGEDSQKYQYGGLTYVFFFFFLKNNYSMKLKLKLLIIQILPIKI